MINHKELEIDEKKRKKQEADDKKRREIEHQEWLKEYEKKNLAKVEKMLDGPLDELIKKANAQGIKTIWLTEYKVWKPSKFWPRDEMYDVKFRLDFDPKKDYKPTKALIKGLKDAGFGAKVIEEWRGNVEYITTADGYDIVDAPGKHQENYLQISW